jgi:hypothetical protein
MASKRMIRELTELGRCDWVTAADVAWLVRRAGDGSGVDEIRLHSLDLIDTVLRSGLMRVGDVTDGGFFPWRATAEQALRRVDESWRELGRLPDLGEVCWLENTAKGDDLSMGLDVRD